MAVDGYVRYRSGLAAEASVARRYEQRGCRVEAQRWRGRAGEIDIIARLGDEVIFIEVKKSSSFARAAERLGTRQLARIHASACEYLGTQPGGQNTGCRFDVALVDDAGRIELLENVMGA